MTALKTHLDLIGKFKWIGKMMHNIQGLIQKEKVHVDCDKGAQISILANKIATLWWPNIVNRESKQTTHYIYFLFSHYYVADLIKKLELQFQLKIKFGHAQISAQNQYTDVENSLY